MKPQTLLLIFICLGGIQAKVSADTWCNSTYPPDEPSCQSNAIFCDDFDRYCNGAPACPPPPPMPCDGSSWSVAQLRAVWVPSSTNPNGLCGTQFTIEDDTVFLTSAPFGGRYPCQGDAQLGQQTVELVPYIQYKFGNDYTAVMGTDMNPLILRFDMSGGIQTAAHVQNDTGYLELALDDAKAPMDYILVGVEEDPVNNPGCISCYRMCSSPHFSVHVAWPHVCQSYEPRMASPHCPPLQTNVRDALAIGTNALLDNNPCHCETPANQMPHNSYLSFYDGLKWRIINPNHAGPGGETLTWSTDSPTGKYFVLGKKINTVVLTIKTSTVDIYHRTKDWDTGDWVVSTVTGISRQYLGPFNKLRGGTGTGCELRNGSYSCIGNTRCIKVGDTRCDGGGFQNNNAGFLAFDGVALYDGLGDTQAGACCLTNGICMEVVESECQGINGQFEGPATTCANTLCCPVPFADSDGDGDVDQDDFAVFQTCFTGPGPATLVGQCICFDRPDALGNPPDGDIDGDDFIAFQNCASGPAIPLDPACDNTAGP
ncbi:MAG: hypothetical protein ACYTBZ_11040 [Planctomycetota bacterium]